VEALKHIRPLDRTAIVDSIERVLAVNPTLESKTRVKRLHQPAPTAYRLRVGQFRVFYNVGEGHVRIVRILSKDEAVTYTGETENAS
jgi:mRNA-degrading endonuclease RelE of RelBE toxin-antitoxin system